MFEDAFGSVVRAEGVGDDIACRPAVLVASDWSRERSVTDDATRLSDTASVEAGDVTDRPALGDYRGCCGCVCCCHAPDREDPSQHCIQPCDAQTGVFIEVYGVSGNLL